jgi:hypothetical protein
MRTAHWLGVLVLGFFALAGCSKIKFALGLAPWYAERAALKQLPPLNAGQEKLLKAEIQKYWAWNKRHMMPAYGATLRRLAAGLTSTAASDPNDLALSAALVTGLYDQSLEPLLKPTAALLHSFDGDQVTRFEALFHEDQERQRERYLSDPEKTFRTRVDKLRSTLEGWTGKLSEAQAQRLEALAHNFNIPYQAWLNDKARRQAELIKALREHRSEAYVQTLLHEWWLRARTGGESREDWQWDAEALQQHVQDIAAVLEPAQKARMSEKLLELAGELEALAVEPGVVPKPTAGQSDQK